MKKNLKEFTKKYIAGFITGIILFGTIGVYAAAVFPSNQTTYDNSTTGMQATEVQGALDELYTTCFPPTAGDQILDKEEIVTSGDGLYEDEYEDGKYTYKGANPNNYVTFNNETAGWRIISINSDGSIKIMKDELIEYIKWDTSGNNNWNRPATLNTYLNSTYYNSLTSTAQSQIVEASYYAGAVTYDNNDMQDQINDEKLVVSNVKVALPTVSEYIRACSNTSCKTFKAYNDNAFETDTCKDSNWMFYDSMWWTLSPRADSSNRVFVGYDFPAQIVDYMANYSVYDVRPALTLSSKIQITGGNGSKSNPYTLG